MGIFNAEKVSALFNVILATKQSVDLFQGDLLGLRNAKPDEYCKEKVDTGKHVEGVEAAVVEEGREELLDYGIGNVLSLRGHTDSLGSNVHGENFGGPNPGGGTPRWLV